jgi:OOP family OmpA-OmpF porin
MDLLYHFLAEQDFVPFLALGAGVAEVSPDGLDSDTDLLLAYGGGFKYFLNDRVALRFDARHLLDINDEDIQRKDDLVHNLSFVGGFTFNFGSISSTPATYSSEEKETADQVAEKEVEDVIEKAEVAAKPVVDSDRDGVIDSLDRCADTPPGTLVDAKGCPEPVKFVDSDSDGVADALDACKNTAAGAEVDMRGCPLPDGDMDGVLDRDDTCPGTGENLPVDEYGCPKLSEKLKIAGLVIEYATGQSVFSDEAARELRLLAAKVNSTQQGMLVVEGHTDSVGGVFYNVELSKERAEKVRKALIDDFGVPADRVVSKGLGPYQPIADNNTQEGRQQNRRVVVRYQP